MRTTAFVLVTAMLQVGGLHAQDSQTETTAEEAPLFTSTDPISFTIRAPFETLFKDRSEDAPELPATLLYEGPDGQMVSLDLDVELRGLDKFLPVFLDHEYNLMGLVNEISLAAYGLFLSHRQGRRLTMRRGAPHCSLDAAAFAWPATIVRNRRHVTNCRDDKSRRLQRAQRRFTAGTRPLHLDFKRFDTMFRRLLSGILSGHLSGVGRRFTRAAKTHSARRRPGDRISLHIGNGNHGVVERGVHMSDAR